jgi:hypothetical protein
MSRGQRDGLVEEEQLLIPTLIFEIPRELELAHQPPVAVRAIPHEGPASRRRDQPAVRGDSVSLWRSHSRRYRLRCGMGYVPPDGITRRVRC